MQDPIRFYAVYPPIRFMPPQALEGVDPLDPEQEKLWKWRAGASNIKPAEVSREPVALPEPQSPLAPLPEHPSSFGGSIRAARTAVPTAALSFLTDTVSTLGRAMHGARMAEPRTVENESYLSDTGERITFHRDPGESEIHRQALQALPGYQKDTELQWIDPETLGKEDFQRFKAVQIERLENRKDLARKYGVTQNLPILERMQEDIANERMAPGQWVPNAALADLMLAQDSWQMAYEEATMSKAGRFVGGVYYGAADLAMIMATGQAWKGMATSAMAPVYGRLAGAMKASTSLPQIARLNSVARGIDSGIVHSTLPVYMSLRNVGQTLQQNPGASDEELGAAVQAGVKDGLVMEAEFAGIQWLPPVPFGALAKKLKGQKMWGSEPLGTRFDRLPAQLAGGALVFGAGGEWPEMVTGALYGAMGSSAKAKRYWEHQYGEWQYQRQNIPRAQKLYDATNPEERARVTSDFAAALVTRTYGLTKAELEAVRGRALAGVEAKAQPAMPGLTIKPVYHATVVPIEREGQEAIRAEELRPGTHFGSIEAANDRLVMIEKKGRQGAPNIMPGQLEMNNPLRLPDVESHDPYTFINDRRITPKLITVIGEEAHARLSNAWNEEAVKIEAMRKREGTEAARKYKFSVAEPDFWRNLGKELMAHGHDGIVYKNETEAPGSDSYIMLQDNQFRSRYEHSAAVLEAKAAPWMPGLSIEDVSKRRAPNEEEVSEAFRRVATSPERLSSMQDAANLFGAIMGDPTKYRPLMDDYLKVVHDYTQVKDENGHRPIAPEAHYPFVQGGAQSSGDLRPMPPLNVDHHGERVPGLAYTLPDGTEAKLPKDARVAQAHGGRLGAVVDGPEGKLFVEVAPQEGHLAATGDVVPLSAEDAWATKYYDTAASGFHLRPELGVPITAVDIRRWMKQHNSQTREMDDAGREAALARAIEMATGSKLPAEGLNPEQADRVRGLLATWDMNPHELANGHLFNTMQIPDWRGELVDVPNPASPKDPTDVPISVQTWKILMALKNEERASNFGSLRSEFENPIYTFERLAPGLKEIFFRPLVKGEANFRRSTKARLQEERELWGRYNKVRALELGHEPTRAERRNDRYEIGLDLAAQDPDGAAGMLQNVPLKDLPFEVVTVDGQVLPLLGTKMDPGSVWRRQKGKELTPAQMVLRGWYQAQFARELGDINLARKLTGKSPIQNQLGYFRMYRLVHDEAAGLGFLNKTWRENLELDQKTIEMLEESQTGMIRRKAGAIFKLPKKTPSETATVLHEGKGRTRSSLPFLYDVSAVYNGFMTAAQRFRFHEPALHRMKYISDYVDPSGNGMKAVAPNSKVLIDTYLDYNSGGGKFSGRGRTSFGRNADRLMRKLTANMHYSALSWSFRTGLIQLSAIRSAFVIAGPIHTFEALKDMTQGKGKDLINWSDFVLTRGRDAHGGEGFTEDLATAMREAHGGTKTARGVRMARNWLGDKGYGFLEVMDTFTTKWTEQAFKRKGESLGLKGEELKNYADDWTMKVAGSTTRYNRTPWQRTTKGRLIAQFQNFNISDFNLLMNDIMGPSHGDHITGTRVGRMLGYLIWTTAANAFYEDLLPTVINSTEPTKRVGQMLFGPGRIHSPFATPLRTLFGGPLWPKFGEWSDDQLRYYEEKGWARRGFEGAKEVAELFPLTASVRYGSTPLGAVVGQIENIYEASSGKRGAYNPFGVIGSGVINLAGTPGWGQVKKMALAGIKMAEPKTLKKLPELKKLKELPKIGEKSKVQKAILSILTGGGNP